MANKVAVSKSSSKPVARSSESPATPKSVSKTVVRAKPMGSEATKKSTLKASLVPARKTRQKDACDLLDADHKAVRKMFDDYQTLAESRGRSGAKKRELADQICLELTVHAAIEEEIFYPAARAAIKDNPLLNEALVEHQTAKDLIAQIRAMDENNEMFDAKVKVLGEYIDHHVKEERNEIFTKVRSSKIDLMAMRDELQNRKEELMAEMEVAETM